MKNENILHGSHTSFYQLYANFKSEFLMNVFLAAAAKEEEAEDDDDMDGFQTDDEDDGSDKEMGVDTEDGDEADSLKFQKLAAQVHFFFLCNLAMSLPLKGFF